MKKEVKQQGEGILSKKCTKSLKICMKIKKFRGSAVHKFFAEIYFRGLAVPKFFAEIYFRGLANLNFFVETYFSRIIRSKIFFGY